MAVPAHQAHPFLPIDLEADAIEQGLSPKTLGQVLGGNHDSCLAAITALVRGVFFPNTGRDLKAELLNDPGCARKLLGHEKDIADVDADRTLEVGDDVIISDDALIGHVEDDPDLFSPGIQRR